MIFNNSTNITKTKNNFSFEHKKRQRLLPTEIETLGLGKA